MSKTAYFPRASLNSCLELANAVYDLSGSSSIEMVAEKLDKKVSGAFSALIAAGVAFGLISNSRGQLEISDYSANTVLSNLIRSYYELLNSGEFIKPVRIPGIKKILYSNREFQIWLSNLV